MMKVKVVSECIDQDGKRTLNPGEVVDDLSDFERGRHLAEGNVIPFVEREVEKAVKAPTEKRKRRTIGRKKKNESNGR